MSTVEIVRNKRRSKKEREQNGWEKVEHRRRVNKGKTGERQKIKKRGGRKEEKKEEQ